MTMTADELRRELKSRGLSRRRAAQVLGLNKSYLDRLLAGPDSPYGRAIPERTGRLLRADLAEYDNARE